MTYYREILRFHSRKISQRDIALICQCSRNTVNKVLAQAREMNLGWPLQADLTDGELEKILFPDSVSPPSSSRRQPDLEYINKEIDKSGVTLRLLWTEYCTACRLGNEQRLMYSQFCYYYQKYAESKLGPKFKIICCQQAFSLPKCLP